MNENRKVFLINTVISGFFAFFIADFCAAGTIGENPTDQKYVAPEFFVILVIWGIGFLFGLITSLKIPSEQFHVFALVMIWVSIPLGFAIGMQWALWANELSANIFDSTSYS
ncbi:hypothetical protein [Terribacillus saccharophilus]|uniref:hypothetical protein n=1 Tax=Terribacillus saccharophilus TaxID=361277 RepID=UPI003981A719